MTTRTQPVLGDEAFDPHTPGYLADPYARLRELRAQGPCWIDPGTGNWFLLDHAHVEAGLSQIVRGHPDGPDRHVHFPANPFAADGPGHTGPRRLIVPTFTNRAVQQFRARAQEIVDDALAGKTAGGTLHVVDEIGFRLPYHLTCDILGVPDVDNRDDLRDWTWKSLELIDAFLGPEQLQENLAAAGRLAEHLHGVIEWKRGHLADDLLSLVIRAGDEGEVLRREQVVSYVHTLYLAGMHTTVNQVALGLHALLTHRDQWDLLCAQPELLENAVEELLRFEPTAHYFRRTADFEVDLGDLVIPQGTNVLCWIASANRDEGRWGERADVLDIARPDARQHLAFGFGPHTCIGSWLARLELQVVIGTLAARFPNTQLPEQPLVWASNVIRGPEELVLELRP
jgi:cytochrome P450